MFHADSPRSDNPQMPAERSDTDGNHVTMATAIGGDEDIRITRRTGEGSNRYNDQMGWMVVGEDE